MESGHDTGPVRRLTLADLPACLDLARDRDWPAEDHKWRLLFEVGEIYGSDSAGGGLAATVATVRYGRATTAVSMMLVARRHERRGLGGRLMRHALAASGTAGAVLSATEFGRPLYERLGFRTTGRYDSLGGTPAAPPGGFPADGTRPAQAADLPDMAAMDAAVFGAPRSALLKRLPSAVTRLHVARTPGGRLTGYAAAWPSTGESVIGPVIADDEATAITLIGGLFAALPGPLRVDLLDHHPAVTDWVRATGMSVAFTTDAMTYGDPPPGEPGRLFGPVALAFG
ncbi:GNAT family N-acetyltransferase [Spongiactinospora sp. TRM90649]|uniref:GNAT family N-acetyltransferase n=1 Tax=Spongiactinospora sp. TRM90649 TaxID=3031114 RepID=UPI0023F9EA24|nr:GNAT family N-acetyltransferase [Spongiactinospora sp. TRM90649]MDF5756540.1 GNAT family N-acetyltransferase [Spongiactinospora sp. TRM90649]